ncbi:MAG: ABC transporter ATP-binding protein [Pirellulales bacterium]|nr:ABC transporter ATP-binding protein [Pirellulales bacterium]
MIELDEVTRRYGRKVAVDRLSMRIAAGELFAFLGPNGAGKTTTIKMLVGLLWPSAGTVRVGGFDLVHQTREAARLLGYVPEEPFLYEKLSGREFLEFTGRMRGLAPAELARRIERQRNDFQLDAFLDALVETYSHGMRQRLAFASALLHEPAVLVVDEPTVGLDPRSVHALKELLRGRAAAGTAVFMSTHTLAVAEEIADRIGIVHEGRLAFLGTRDEVRRQMAHNGGSLERLFLRLTGDADAAPLPPTDQE